MATNVKAVPALPGTALNAATCAQSSIRLPRDTTPVVHGAWPMCPFRVIEPGENPRCWGERCAAFRPVDAAWGVCLLIERE